MTIGVFAPLMAVLNAFYILYFYTRKIRELPGRTEGGYGEEVERKRRGYMTIIVVSFIVPPLLYLMLNVVSDVGHMDPF